MEITQKSKNYLYGSLSFFLIFTAWAIWWGFFQIWLTSDAGGIKLNGTQVGTFFSFYAIFTVIVLFLYGTLQDRFDLRRHLLIFISILVICCGPFFTFVFRPLITQNLILGSMLGSCYLSFGFSGAIAISEAYLGRFCVRAEIIFGRMRVWASFGYALALFTAGFIFTINPLLIFWVSSLLGVLLLSLQIFWKVEISAINISQKTVVSENSPAMSMWQEVLLILRDKKLWVVMLFSLCTWSLYQIYEAQMFPDFFTSYFVDSAEGQRVFGIFVGIQTTAESLLMSIVPIVLAKYGVKKTLTASAVIMCVIVFGSAFAVSLFTVMATKIFHALLAPLLLLGLMEYVTQHFDLRFTATIYLIGFYVTSYAGNIILSRPLGILRDMLGYQGVFIIFGIIMAFGIFVGIFGFEKDEARKVKNEISECSDVNATTW